MDQSDRSQELSEKTGLTVESCLDLAYASDMENTAYSVYSPARNIQCIIRIPRRMSDDPCFDLPAYVRSEMDWYCDQIQAERGYSG